MAKSTFKKDQYAQSIQNEFNAFLRSEVSNPLLQFVSITKVELTNDFSKATLFWDTFDPSKKGDIKSAIESVAGKGRTHLARVLKVRHIPEIHMAYDSQFEDEQAIDQLLKKAQNGDHDE